MSVTEVSVDGKYEVPAGVYIWRGFQNSERDSVIARVKHANDGVVLSYENLSKGLGLPLGHPDVGWVFNAAVEYFSRAERVLIINDTPRTARYVKDVLGELPRDLREVI